MSQPTPFDMLIEQIRAVVREEIAAANSNGHKVPKLLVDTKTAAEMLDVPETWLAQAAREGKVPSLRLGHYVRFKVTDLEQFLERKAG